MFAYQLIALGSVEERMLELQQRKFALVGDELSYPARAAAAGAVAVPISVWRRIRAR